MTNTRKLTGPIIDKGNSTKFLVFFLHGWGSDGNDLIQIGEIWKSKLLDTTFIAPNGPEVCGGNPHGRQWFDILSNNDTEALKGLHQSYLDLKIFIDTYLKKYKLANYKYFLVGFSQGTMLAIYTSLREKLLGVVGYSGAFLGSLPNEEEIKKNEYILLHGQNDTIVPIAKMHNAVDKLEPIANTLIKKIYNDLEHSINEEGIIEGLNFIKERK
jgi:phospholipase/carboxylesterase